jgi:hypothetical protein
MAIVIPKTPAPGKPWVFRADAIDRNATVDLALLAKGYHTVTPPVTRQSGMVQQQWDETYKTMVLENSESIQAAWPHFSRWIGCAKRNIGADIRPEGIGMPDEGGFGICLQHGGKTLQRRGETTRRILLEVDRDPHV